MLSTGICRWLFLLISLSTWTTLIDSKEMRVVCYYTNWSVYRPGQAKFSPQNINPYLCTHLVYAFGGFTKENTLKPFDKYQDIEKGGYAKFIGLKTYNKNLKTLIAIGGWNEGSSRFSPMVASAERRKELVKNAIKFLRQNHFDGLDLDWEYPTFRDGGKPRDRDNYANLVKELREEFERESEKTGRPRLLLTMAVPAGIEYINKGYDVPKLNKYLDWMNILSYDYHSAFEPAVNHHAPLYPLEEDNEYNYDAELNIDYTIKHYIKLGADPNKLVLGIPTYGRSYTLFNPDAYELGSPADGPGDMGEATRENGYLAYYEICEYVKDQDWEVDEPNPDAMGPIAFKDNQWVGYDDENIVKRKAEYVAENSLGGIMFWAIDNDDFRGNCHGKPYPLIEAGKEALLNAYGLTEENLISPPSKPTKSSKQKPRNRTRKTTTTTTTEVPEESSVSKSSSSRRRRIKSKSKGEDRSRSSSVQKRRKELNRKAESSTYSSLKIVTPAYTTPAPPATPDMDGAFKCEDEGFFQHPKDCKKYFWCLGGPGDTGIVAHQFTCPAGLFFNKAADSCDYSQNVLCNKKLAKSTTTTTEETTKSSTTEKPPPKITAATSKNTFRATTTTEAYQDDDDYEYEDDEEDTKPEDPKVIKELLDLIKKAGGIEELEKQLKIGKDSSSQTVSSDSTTPSPISKLLVDRVLARNKNTLNALKKSQISTSRNSGGPQASGLSDEKKENKIGRARPQYKTLFRQRPSTEKSIEEEDTIDEPVEDEPVKERKSFRSKSALEYVNIRRPKTSSSTTEANDDDGFNRNKILGETDEEELDDEPEVSEVTKKSNTPQYVNIRRTRPSTTEATATSSKYTSIRRSTISPVEDEDGDDSNEADADNRYNIIRRGTPTESGDVSENQTSRYQTIRRGTTTTPTTIEDENESKRRGTTTTITSVNDVVDSKYSSLSRLSATTTATGLEDNNETTSKYQSVRRGSTTPLIATTSELTSSTTLVPEEEINSATEDLTATTLSQETSTTSISSLATDNLVASTHESSTESNSDVPNSSIATSSVILTEITESLIEKKRPLLFQPRPFSVNPESTVRPKTTESTTVASKVSQSNLRFRLRQTSSPTTTTEASSTTIRSRSRSRFSTLNRNSNEDRDQEEKYERSEDNKPVRTRKRPLVVTTEQPVDLNDEYDRKYRPAELADLSSLTAADLTLGRGEFISSHKRRRPVSSTATTTTEEILTDYEKTGSRTLPLVRKLIDPSTFGKNRRIIANKEDQDNASSDQGSTTGKIVRGYRSTTPRTSLDELEVRNNNVESEKAVRVTSRTRKIFRRVRPISSTTTPIENAVSEEISSTSTTPRTSTLLRKRIPLFRARQNKNRLTTVSSSTVSSITEPTESTNSSESPLLKLFKARSRFDIANNDTLEDDEDELSNEHTDVLNGEEGENIKLSESNIRESSHINTFGSDEKPSRRFSKLNFAKSGIFEKPVKEKPVDELAFGVKTETTTEKQENVDTTTKANAEVSLTEPSRILRTRKIIRRISTTTEPTISTTTSSGRRRLFLRRPQPTISELENTTKDEEHNRQTQRSRQYLTINRSTSEPTNIESEIISKNTLFEPKSPGRYRPRFGGRTTTEESEINDEEVSSERGRLRVSRPTTTSEVYPFSTSRYNFNTRFTSSTADFDEDDDEEDNEETHDFDHEEDIDDDDYNHEESFDNDDDDKPKFTTFTTSSIKMIHKYESNINFDEDNEKDADDSLNTNKSVSSFILTKATNSSDESETLADKDEELNTERIDQSTAETKEKENNEEKTEISTKRNILFRPQQKRPSFTRQRPSPTRDEVQLKTQKTILKTIPNYRSRFTPTSLTTVITTASSTIPLSELAETTMSEFSDSSTLHTETNAIEATTGLFVGESKEEASTSVLDTTENVVITSSSFNSVTEENSETNDSSLTTTDVINESTLKQVTEETTFSNSTEIEETTVSLNSEDATDSITSTTYLVETSSSQSSNLSESTTKYQRRSTLRSLKDRPKFGYSRRTTTEAPSSRKSYTRNNNFSKNRKTFLPGNIKSTASTTISTTPVIVNRLLYKYSTTEANIVETDDLDDEENSEFEDEEQIDNDEVTNEEEDDEEENAEEIEDTSKGLKLSFSKSSTSTRIANEPFDKKKLKNEQNKPEFIKTSSKTASTENTVEDIGIDTTAVKNRNKNLFNKRKMNVPFKPSVILTTEDSSTSESAVTIGTSDYTTTPVSAQTDSTDPNLTTLHHIFAEVETDSTTEPVSSVANPNPSKVERLIEVNRIVEVKTKQAKVKSHSGAFEVATKVEINPTVDKIGEISRITLIKIVDGNNETVIKDSDSNEIHTNIGTSPPSPIYLPEETKSPLQAAKIEEIPASEVLQNVNVKNIEFNINMENNGPLREDRKYEIFGESKVADNKIVPFINGKVPEIIDGTSHINIVTPKPLTSETSTISLEGLFQTEKSSHLNPGFTSNDEVLETGPSEFVDVRVLDQDKGVRLDKGLRANTNLIPVRILPQDEEEVTMKAHVVELKPNPNARTIKIVPIRVEMSRSLANNIRLPPNQNSIST